MWLHSGRRALRGPARVELFQGWLSTHFYYCTYRLLKMIPIFVNNKHLTYSIKVYVYGWFIVWESRLEA